MAGIVGSVVSGAPSTLWTVLEGGDPCEGGRALGQGAAAARGAHAGAARGGRARARRALDRLGVRARRGASRAARAVVGRGSAASRSPRSTWPCWAASSRRSPRCRRAASGPTTWRSGSAWESCCEPRGERPVGLLEVAGLDDGARADQRLGHADVVAPLDAWCCEPCTTQSRSTGSAPAASRNRASSGSPTQLACCSSEPSGEPPTTPRKFGPTSSTTRAIWPRSAARITTSCWSTSSVDGRSSRSSATARSASSTVGPGAQLRRASPPSRRARAGRRAGRRCAAGRRRATSLPRGARARRRARRAAAACPGRARAGPRSGSSSRAVGTGGEQQP